VNAFEREFATYHRIRHAVGVGSGTEALHLALAALNVGEGDEVITVSHTAVATVSAIELTGAKPVLVDIDPQYYTLDPALLEAAISPRTKVIIAVHLYGQAAAIQDILSIAHRHGIKVIEDCAQATGTKIGQKRAGTLGDIGCFSFYPTKNLGAIGDGGALITNDDEIAKRIRLLRQYGWEERSVSKISGWNSRLDELQAGVLRVKLKYLDQDNQKRVIIAKQYGEAFNGLAQSSQRFSVPQVREETLHTFHLYVLQTRERDALLTYLKERQIQCMIHYPMPVHLQPAYLGKIRLPGSMKFTEDAANTVISLPMYPELEVDSVRKVIEAVKDFFQK
jgi:dTDP-4-amino-4,6-dideoxygalactose transaminase